MPVLVDEPCHICQDRATGRHYGAISCDGCKGFFRRSIRKRHNYVCRFEHHCCVDKSQRNACRACRLSRCMDAGMKPGAIQQERDSIGKRKKKSDAEQEPAPPPCPLLERLIQSEKLCQQLRSSVIKRTEQVNYECARAASTSNGVAVGSADNDSSPSAASCSSAADTVASSSLSGAGRLATLDDVGKSIHQQLVLLVEWAKSLPSFVALSIHDQAALLKSNAATVIVLGVSQRSMPFDDTICLANDAMLPRRHSSKVGDINCVVGRILDELVTPMRRLRVELADFVALKAICFFNHVSRDLVAQSEVERIRCDYIRALELRTSREACRTSLLLLLLPAAAAISQQLVEDVQLARLFGLANVDSLMQELILNDGSQSSRAVLSSLTTPSDSGNSNGSSNGGSAIDAAATAAGDSMDLTEQIVKQEQVE